MHHRGLQSGLLIVFSLVALLAIRFSVAHANENAALPNAENEQQPTVSIPTVTGTATGPIAVVSSDPEDQINVRSGPGLDYPKIGVLLNHQQVPALGRTPGGTWVMIIYPGVQEGVAWVYAPLVNILGGELPIVEPPPTPTPLVTPTIDPTLAAQFVVDIPPTRMPTFTPPPPLVIPTFTVQEPTTGTGNVPIGFVISGLSVLGLFGLFLSLLRRR
jgi:hypothetical protein